MARRIAFAVIALAALWLIALVVLDSVVGARQAARIASRVGESLQASASVGDVDLALVRGRLSIVGLAVHRDDAVGHLALDVPDVTCELPPLGGGLFDRDCGELAVRGVRLDVSSLAMFHPPHPQRRPIRAGRVSIVDSVLAFWPSAFLPELGKIEIRIDRADAGATILRTPLSWICTMTELDATLALPAGLAVHLSYAKGTLSASGSLLGASPVDVPLELPQCSDDPREQSRALIALGEQVAERLVMKRAADLLH
ncbi:MAG TPA: hypothetical protein VGG74_08720 [Kofleriaceae bacterium]|jgi:hypothetical protein